MCTVSIVPLGKNNFVLTSNRDEAPNRVSLAPQIFTENDVKLLYPKDVEAGGTWIGVGENKRAVCLLNGAKEGYDITKKFERSRGLVVKDFLTTTNLQAAFNSYNLEGVAPFTMVIIDWNLDLSFFELLWDGQNKIWHTLPLEPKVWSSSTLYNKQMKEIRKHWFDTFTLKNNLTAASLLKFHKTAGLDNNIFGVIMDRGPVKTTSITQVKLDNHVVEMYYEDLQNPLKTVASLNMKNFVNG